MIPYENLHLVNQKFEEAFQEKFKAFLKKGWYVLGEEVKIFEDAFAAFHNSKYCIGVANGLDALIIALKALQLPNDAEVIVPSNTYIATILSVIHAGLKPVLVEPDIQTYNIDPSLIEASVSSKTKAIVVVHLYGKCCNMEAIQSIATKHNLFVLEDCAQSHNAKFKDQLAGTFGVMSAFSFYPTKNLGALGDAGAVLCNGEQHATAIQQLRNYGSSKKYENQIVGYNSRLDELQAAFLNIKLSSLEEITRHKRKLAKLYLENLKSDFILPKVEDDYFDVYHIFNIRHPKRDDLKAYLLKHEIGSEIHYPIPPHKQKAMQAYFEGMSFPVSEEIHQTTLSLPCSFAHSTSEIERVIEVLNDF